MQYLESLEWKLIHMIPLSIITKRQGLHPKMTITTAMENAVVTRRPIMGLEYLLISTDSSRYTGVRGNPGNEKAEKIPTAVQNHKAYWSTWCPSTTPILHPSGPEPNLFIHCLY